MIASSLGLLTLGVVAVLWLREALLLPAALLAVVSGSLLSGWLGKVTGLLVKVLTRWGEHLSAEAGGIALPWLLTGALVVVFLMGMTQGADRLTVILGLLVPSLVATLPGPFGEMGGDTIGWLVSLWAAAVDALGGAVA